MLILKLYIFKLDKNNKMRLLFLIFWDNVKILYSRLGIDNKDSNGNNGFNKLFNINQIRKRYFYRPCVNHFIPNQILFLKDNSFHRRKQEISYYFILNILGLKFRERLLIVILIMLPWLLNLEVIK